MPRWRDGLVNAFPIPDDKGLSLDKLKISEDMTQPSQASVPNPNPLRFFDFPAEIRNRVYHYVLFSKPEYRRADGSRRGSRLAVLLASKRFHKEASYVLYATKKFLIFPLQQFTALPTIQELPLRYRLLVTGLEMIIGPSWTDPPKSWRVSKGLVRCLKRLKTLQTLSVFVEFDPTHPAFKLKRISQDFYTDFCGELVEDVLQAMPQLKYVQIDGNPAVDVHGPLVSRIRREAEKQDLIVMWGKVAGWAYTVTEQTVRETKDDTTL